MQAGNLLLHPVVEATMMKQKKVGGGGGLALGEAVAAGMGTTSRSSRSERQPRLSPFTGVEDLLHARVYFLYFNMSYQNVLLLGEELWK